jgi:hypothetical protein
MEQSRVFGYGAGCSFLTNPCNTTEGGLGRWWCRPSAPNAAVQCSVRLDAVAKCSLTNFTAGTSSSSPTSSALPAWAQYGFTSSDFPFGGSSIGGNQWADYCPLPQAFANRMCEARSHVATTAESQEGYIFGNSSRCLVVTPTFRRGAAAVAATSNAAQLPSQARCLQAECWSDTPAYRVIALRVDAADGNPSWVFCKPNMTSVAAPAGVTGTITCPESFDRFCDGYLLAQGAASASAMAAYFAIPATPAPDWKEQIVQFFQPLTVQIAFGVGGGVLLIIILVIVICCCCKKKGSVVVGIVFMDVTKGVEPRYDVPDLGGGGDGGGVLQWGDDDKGVIVDASKDPPPVEAAAAGVAR